MQNVQSTESLEKGFSIEISAREQGMTGLTNVHTTPKPRVLKIQMSPRVWDKNKVHWGTTG